MRNHFTCSDKEVRDALDFVDYLDWNLLCCGRSKRALDGECDLGLVPHAGQAIDRTAGLALRPGLDAALRADGRGRLARVAVGPLTTPQLGSDPLSRAVGVELCLAAHFLSLSRHRRSF